MCAFQVLLDHQRGDEYVGDFCDGKLYKEHELFRHHPQALQIIAYFDEVEVCNPLAGHAGVHKLGIVLVYNCGTPLTRTSHNLAA